MTQWLKGSPSTKVAWVESWTQCFESQVISATFPSTLSCNIVTLQVAKPDCPLLPPPQATCYVTNFSVASCSNIVHKKELSLRG